MPARLIDRHPELSPGRILAELVPPPHFADVRFGTFLPDPEQPSQGAAVTALRAFARDTDAAPARRRGRLGRRRTAAPERTGAYLDGGFGVGKTHLLASLWYEASHPKAYGTFVELTNLVGALGFEAAATALGQHRLLCIDEFELDDPGDTVLMSSLLRRLVESGVRLAATSNTLPGKLGEGRFAADDFMREIQGLSAYFDVLRIDGEDYRHRGLSPAPEPYDDATLVEMAHRAGDGATLDDFDAVVEHLGRVHPSRYGALLDGVTALHLRAVETVEDQSVALRLVVLADRLYDCDVPVAGERRRPRRGVQRRHAHGWLPQEVLPRGEPARCPRPRRRAGVMITGPQARPEGAPDGQREGQDGEDDERAPHSHRAATAAGGPGRPKCARRTRHPRVRR